MTLEELWNILEAEARKVPLIGIQVRRIRPESQRDLYLGFMKPDERRIFLLRVLQENLPGPARLPSLRGVESFALVLPSDVPNHGSLGIILRESRYSDLFSELVGDLSQHIAVQPGDGEAVEAFLARLEKWHKFLESHSEGLSEEEQRGLYGELKFLGNHVIPLLGTTGVHCWTGGKRTPQDFQFLGCAVEVKTSIAKQLQVLRIANERQLDDTHLEALFLYHLSLAALRGTGETLPELVTAVRTQIKADTCAQSHFEDALIEAGYMDAHAGQYAFTGYSIREENLFQIREGFPRIIERELPLGVGEVGYSISVAECRHYAISLEKLNGVLKTGAAKG